MPGPERAGTRTGPSGALSAGCTRWAGRFSTEEGVAEGPDRMGRRRDRTKVSLDLDRKAAEEVLPAAARLA